MAKADRDSIVHYSLRLNLKNPRHLEIHKILKHLNQEMNKTQNQLFIAALEFYVDNVGKANLVELDKIKSNEYVTKDDIEEIKEELHASVITEASETVLKDYIEMIGDRYDYIVIDCSPNLGQLTLNALVAADEIIIPVQPAYLPIKGLQQLLKTISRVKRKMNPKLHIMGILLTMVDYRTNYANDIIDVVYNAYV